MQYSPNAPDEHQLLQRAAVGQHGAAFAVEGARPRSLRRDIPRTGSACRGRNRSNARNADSTTAPRDRRPTRRARPDRPARRRRRLRARARSAADNAAIAVDDLEVGVAKSGGAHPHQYVGGLQRRGGDGFDRQRRLRRMQHRGAIAQRHQATALPASAASAASRSAEVISHSLSKLATTARMKGSTAALALSGAPR